MMYACTYGMYMYMRARPIKASKRGEKMPRERCAEEETSADEQIRMQRANYECSPIKSRTRANVQSANEKAKGEPRARASARRDVCFHG